VQSPPDLSKVVVGKWKQPFDTSEISTGRDLTTYIEFTEDGMFILYIGKRSGEERKEVIELFKEAESTYKVVGSNKIEWMSRGEGGKQVIIPLTVKSFTSRELVLEAPMKLFEGGRQTSVALKRNWGWGW
jgi:hypothetical protein